MPPNLHPCRPPLCVTITVSKSAYLNQVSEWSERRSSTTPSGNIYIYISASPLWATRRVRIQFQ
eukprot:624569-Karenia_brevis.AAC.1